MCIWVCVPECVCVCECCVYVCESECVVCIYCQSKSIQCIKRWSEIQINQLISTIKHRKCFIKFLYYTIILYCIKLYYVFFFILNILFCSLYFLQFYVDGDFSSLNSIASSLFKLEKTIGTIPNFLSKGTASRKVLQKLLKHRSESSDIDNSTYGKDGTGAIINSSFFLSGHYCNILSLLWFLTFTQLFHRSRIIYFMNTLSLWIHIDNS